MNSTEIFFTKPLAESFHKREVGVGVIRHIDGEEVGCRFVMEQVPSGDIALRCLLDTIQTPEWRKRRSHSEWYEAHTDLVLNLETERGYRLENFAFDVTGGITVNGYRQSYEFDLSHLTLKLTRQLPTNNEPVFAEFSLVNSKLRGGNTCVRFSKSWYWDSDVIALSIDGRECWIKPIKNADKILKEIEEKKGIDITAQLIIPLQSDDKWDDAAKIADKLCTVLTLLTGNHVTWISGSILSVTGYPLEDHYRNSITTPYSNRDILSMLCHESLEHRASAQSYVPIINRMMKDYNDIEEKFDIHAVINTWHKAVNSELFIEQRGLLMAGCVERVRNCYRIRTDNIKNLSFKDSLLYIARELNITAFGPDSLPDTIQQRWSQRMNNFTMNESDLEKSIACFVRIRNCLVHQGDYILSASKTNHSVLDERVEQLRFLQSFTSSFLCSALGWSQPLPQALNLPQ